mgnify:CR=1 FL=1
MACSMKKKKFKDTKVGSFLIGKGGIASALAESIPDRGLLGIVKNLVGQDNNLTPQDKETAMKLLDLDIAEMEGVTKRWESDMASDSKLAKIVRPLIILYLTLAMTIYIVLESAGVISIKSSWISLYETIMVATYVSYFGGRSIEKYAKIRK